MDKNTLGNYGWVVITVIIISIMIALACPFAGALIGNVVGLTNDFTSRLDAALSGINDSTEGSEDELQMNEYGFYFNQPYQMLNDDGTVAREVIFYEDGSFWALSSNSSSGFRPGSLVYTTDGVVADGNIIATSANNGTELNVMGNVFVLKETPVSSIQKGKIYKAVAGSEASNAGEEFTFVFKEDGSITYSSDRDETTVFSNVEYFDHYLIIHNFITGYDAFLFIYPDGTIIGSDDGIPAFIQ